MRAERSIAAYLPIVVELRPLDMQAPDLMVGRDGFEPSTSGLKVRCSTD
jgi:hypothetical protein